MRNRALKYGYVVLVAAILFLPACSSSGVKGNVKVPKTEPGVGYKLPGGTLKLTQIQGPADDRTMTFTLKNVSGTPIEDVTARVLFYLPPPKGSVQAFSADPREVTFNSFAGESFDVTLKPTLEGEIVGWRLLVHPSATVSREGDVSGSTFLEGTLECTDLTDKMTATVPAVSFVVTNVSEEAQELLEYRVRLTKGSDVWESPWQPVEGKIQPGASVTLTPDVSDSKVSGVANILLKIQRSVL